LFLRREVQLSPFPHPRARQDRQVGFPGFIPDYGYQWPPVGEIPAIKLPVCGLQGHREGVRALLAAAHDGYLPDGPGARLTREVEFRLLSRCVECEIRPVSLILGSDELHPVAPVRA